MSKTVGNIKDVELLEVTLSDGSKTGDRQFIIKTTDGQEIFAVADPENRFYRDVKEWYAAQKEKPFKFKFVALDK